jgi:hypothetical protein
MFVSSSCSIMANATVFASVRISDPPVYLLVCYGRRLKSVVTRPPTLLIISLAEIDFEIRSYDRPISESSDSGSS